MVRQWTPLGLVISLTYTFRALSQRNLGTIRWILLGSVEYTHPMDSLRAVEYVH